MTINETIKKPNDIYDFSELRDINIDMLALALSKKVKKILNHRLWAGSEDAYFKAYYSVSADLIDDFRFDSEQLNKQNNAILDAISDMINYFDCPERANYYHQDSPVKEEVTPPPAKIMPKAPPPVYWEENVYWNKWRVDDWIFTARIDRGSNGEYKVVRFKTRPTSKYRWNEDEKIFPSYSEAMEYCSYSPENHWGLGW